MTLFFFLKIAKKELDQKRSKGPNHNSSRISQLENQIRQYEQQLNDIKRRLESIEVLNNLFFLLLYPNSFQPSIDSLPNKTDDNHVNRSNTFAEPTTNRTNTVSRVQKKGEEFDEMNKFIPENDFFPHPHIYFSSQFMATVVTKNRIHCLNQQPYK